MGLPFRPRALGLALAGAVAAAAVAATGVPPAGAAPTSSGLGTADLGGGLDLHVPTSTAPGTYTATLTLTAV